MKELIKYIKFPLEIFVKVLGQVEEYVTDDHAQESKLDQAIAIVENEIGLYFKIGNNPPLDETTVTKADYLYIIDRLKALKETE